MKKSNIFALTIILSMFCFLSARTSYISGYVIDAKGNPLSDVKISVAESKRSTQSKENGYFKISNLTRNRVSIVFSKPSYDVFFIENISIKNKSVNDLTIILVKSNSKSKAKNRVNYSSKNNDTIYSASSKTTSKSKIKSKLRKSKEALAESTQSDLFFRLDGYVEGNYGERLSQVEIKLNGTKQKTYSETNGYFCFEKLKPGEYKIDFYIDEHNKDSKKIKLIGDEEIIVVLKITDKKTRLVGKVKDENGKPLAYASVIVEGTRLGATTKENGEYIISNIPPGKYNIVCQMMSYKLVKINNIVIKPNKTSKQDFYLEKVGIEMQEFSIVEKKKTKRKETVNSSSKKDKPNKVDLPGASIDPVYEKKEVKENNPEIIAEFEVGKTEKSHTTPLTPISTSNKKKSGLKAGFVDDNKQYNRFIHFLLKYRDEVYYLDTHIEERIIFNVIDSNGKHIPEANIEIYCEDILLESGVTAPDGTYLFFPSVYDEDFKQYSITLKYDDFDTTQKFYRDGKRNIEIRLPNFVRKSVNNTPIDLLFIMDTTGSMGEEIERLKDTIEIINLNLKEMSNKPIIRFGMVLYKDLMDKYVTKVIPFTDNVSEFQTQLNEVYAQGGGDEPEDLQAALKDAMQKIEWSPNGIRNGFIITDATTHFYSDQDYDYVSAIKDAKQKGIKLNTIGTGGLPIGGEYVLRQISQYTSGKYVFLTYGETGESDGGFTGSVSHHTGANYNTDKLESIVIHMIKEDYFKYIDKEMPKDEEYYEATFFEEEKPEKTLAELFKMALNQLKDYSSIKLDTSITCSVVPLVNEEKLDLAYSEYFTANLLMAVSKDKQLQLIERKDMQKIVSELEFQLSGFLDLERAAKLGRFIGAEKIITGESYQVKDNFEIYLKLLDVETAEVLAVTKVVIDEKLGL